MLYFDHCATTPPYGEVVEVYSQICKEHYGNPSSIHRKGVEAERLLTKAREVIATSLNVKPREIIFTSGGTESNNMAIHGITEPYEHQGKHVITSVIEHASVSAYYKQLEAKGFNVTYLPVDATGQVDIQALKDALGKETILVSIMHVNNEMGRIQPIAEIGELLKSYPSTLFHVDAIQSIGKLLVNAKAWGVDLLSSSAHKLRGLKGTGFLYCREGVRLQPLLLGGGQEDGLRSGTQNVPAIVAMAKAVRMAMEQQESNEAHLRELRRRLTSHLHSLPELMITGSDVETDMAPHIVHFCYPGMKAEVFVHMLEKHKIYASTQSACSSKQEKPSDILLAMGYDRERALSGIRISFSAEHSYAEIEFLCKAITMTVDKLKPLVRNFR